MRFEEQGSMPRKSRVEFTLIMLSVGSFCCIGCNALSPTITPTVTAIYVENSTSPTLPSTLPELIQLLSSGNDEVRLNAANKIATMGPEARAAVPSLANNLHYDGPYEVRAAAAYALGEIGPDARPAVPDLIDVLATNFVHVRTAAAEALGKIGDRSAIPALVEALNDDDAITAGVAAESIEILAEVNFWDDDRPGYPLDSDGIPLIVKAAKEWWGEEGQYQDWGESQ